MRHCAKVCLLALAASFSSATAHADSVDFARFLSSPAGASGVAVAVASLGHCDTPLIWNPGIDSSNGNADPDALMVSCQFYDKVEEDTLDKSVIAKFHFLDGTPRLESLSYLP